MTTDIYTDGTYLERSGGTWHLQDSPLKASWIARMLARHPGTRLETVCEIGCGAGGILSELQKALPQNVRFTGYEISPQAHALSERFAGPRCRFVLGDAFADSLLYDLVLVMDVVEHVEDSFAFLRQVRGKGRLKLYHVPLEVHVSAALRGVHCWDSAGHLHLFTKETALKALEHTGHRVLDWMLTEGAVAKPGYLRTRLANALRRPIAFFSPLLASRLLGGYSILILAE